MEVIVNNFNLEQKKKETQYEQTDDLGKIQKIFENKIDYLNRMLNKFQETNSKLYAQYEKLSETQINTKDLEIDTQFIKSQMLNIDNDLLKKEAEIVKLKKKRDKLIQ